MKKQIKWGTSTLKVRNNTEGETIEQKLRRVKANKDQIKDSAPPIFTERKDGVMAEYNIRTNKLEVALEAQDQKSRMHNSLRNDKLAQEAKRNQKIEEGNQTIITKTGENKATDD